MKPFAAVLLCASACFAQVTIPDGTKIRVRLDQTISSGTADEGQTVELSVTEAVKVSDALVIPEGARVTGTVTEAREKRRMGRAGKLDFSIDRVRAADGEWVPLRYTLNKKSGDSHAVRTGVITAGVAAVFWPAAPFILLARGKDVTINKGVTYDVFTDANHALVSPAPLPAPVPAPVPARVANMQLASLGSATVNITSNIQGADIEVDGAFVGSTPTSTQLAAGMHQITVRRGAQVWQRQMQVQAGGNVNVNALLGR